MSTSPTETAPHDKKEAHAPHPSPKASAAKKKNLHPLIEQYKRPALIASAVIAGLATIWYVFDSFTHEETDDAYVTGHLHEVSSRINGVVTKVHVDDNQKVTSNEVLVELDSDEYQALHMAAVAQLAKATADYDRQAPLVQENALSQQDLDATKSTMAVDLAQEKLSQLQIDYSTIKAPADGYIGRKNVEVGNRITSGQTLMVVVEPDLWVVANFKETQLAKMRKGQPATISIDALPGHVFTGKVDSFSPATGNEFALLPADNSTGNFTKIVQRVPVKIVFDADSVRGYEDLIRAGESAIVKVALTTPAPEK